MKAIFKRELRSYFTTPAGYIFLAVFLSANGFLFSLNTLKQGKDSSVESYFTYFIMAFILLIPILTMKTFSEEKKAKTDQLLLTAPVSLFSIVMAKFLAAYTVFAMAIAVSGVNFLILYQYGSPSGAVILGSILSVLLIGAACISIGVFISSLTENQIIAAIVTMAVLLVLMMLSIFNSYISVPFLRTVLNWFSILNRFSNFSFGIFDFSALLYYFSLSGIFLFLTVRVFQKRRWG